MSAPMNFFAYPSAPERYANSRPLFRPLVIQKRAITSVLVLAVLCLSACGPPGVGPAASHSGVVGKWRSADGSWLVEFSPAGNCTAHYRLDGRDLGGPCTYSVDPENITIHYYGPGSSPAAGPPNTFTEWRYTLSGDVLTVSTFGNSLVLHRVP
jgi:hypothetical protein